MDYLHLKKTLVAVFDHFLSCHDMSELEEMMQAFEAGKSLVIKLPEAIDREDYHDDVFTREEQKRDDVFTREEQKRDDVFTREDPKRDDVLAMQSAKPRKKVSRIKRKKTKIVSAAHSEIKQIKICDVPVLIDLQKLSKEKRNALKDVLEGDHLVKIHDCKMTDIHGFAKARIFKVVKVISSGERVQCADYDNSFSSGSNQTENYSNSVFREKLIEKIMFEIKKSKDPP